MKKVSAYIIAYNEAAKIKAAIQSVQWADEILVADSHSTDGTPEIAAALGARVVQIPFTGFGDIRNQAIASCSYDWIFSLDSDERCTSEVQAEIQAILRADGPLDACYVPRKNYFMGRWIKHSGYYPDYRQPQLFRKGVMTFKPDPVHEEFILCTKKIGYLKNPIRQIPFKNFEQFQHKANRYSTLGAEKMILRGQKSQGMAGAFFHGLWTFVHHYVVKLGFLDGWAGFMIALGNFEGTFYKYAKLQERQAGWDRPDADVS
jgi:glycosyltransferase involved in cell wall biosynthesis